MVLTLKAKMFLEKIERRAFVKEKEKIIEAIEKAKFPVFDKVVEFQENYGGYTFYAGLAPLVYGIVHNNLELKVKNGVWAEEQEGVWYFDCVDTLYQMSFQIDQYGRYYEEGEILASSFDKYVESLAFCTELNSKGNWQYIEVELNDGFDKNKFLSAFEMKCIFELSDDYRDWWKNEALCVRFQGKNLVVWSKYSLNYQQEKILKKHINYGLKPPEVWI